MSTFGNSTTKALRYFCFERMTIVSHAASEASDGCCDATKETQMNFNCWRATPPLSALEKTNEEQTYCEGGFLE